MVPPDILSVRQRANAPVQFKHGLSPAPREKRRVLEPARLGAGARIPVLDGVRGLAICLVLLVHFIPDYPMPNRPLQLAQKLAHAGWSGIDLSLVLSGLLITNLLLGLRGTTGAAQTFYTRRFLRIMPLYLGSLVFVFGVLPTFVRPGVDPSFDTLQTFQGWYWGLAANVLALLHGFSVMESATVNLGHFWVLAVDQHFYLFWPLMVWTVPERKLPWVSVALIAIALSIRICLLHYSQGTCLEGAIYQTPTCMDSLAFGSLVAVLFRRVDAGWLRKGALAMLPVIAAIVAVLLLIKAVLGSNSVVHSVGLTLVSLAYSSMIVLLRTGSARSLGVKLIDNAFLRFFGKYSYGLYVYHGLMTPLLERWFPAARLLAICQSPVLATVVCLAVKVGLSLGVAMLSWRLIEGPCFKLMQRWAPAATVPAP